MIGEKIKQLRTKSGMTQKELASKLFVTAQAVSRWENGDVEPSVTTITKMSKIFKVTTDEMLGLDPPSEKREENAEKSEFTSHGPSVLALCCLCNRPIFDYKNIVREGSKIYCKECHEKKLSDDAFKKRVIHKEKSIKCKNRRTFSFIFGTVGLIVGIILAIYSAFSYPSNSVIEWGARIYMALSCFTFVSCLFLQNNVIIRLLLGSLSLGFIKMPGIIFDFSIDGFLWFIGVKIFLWLLDLALSLIICAGALILGILISPFVYPFALYKNINHPEDIEI